MLAIHVNSVAVLVATLAAWVFGAVWYRAFVTRWMDALGKTKDEIMPGGRRSLAAMALSFAAQLLMAAVLARFIAAVGPVSVASGLLTAAFCWLGFVLTTVAVTNSYAQTGQALTAVASWHWLGVLLVMGGVIGAFR
jgi:hypothetical protein